MHFKVALTATSSFMTKSELQDLQRRAVSSGTTLKSFLQSEGVAYSTYNYWCWKMKTESEVLPIAPISIRSDSSGIPDTADMPDVDVPGVLVAFPNGVRAYFGRGSERVLMEVLSRSIAGHVLP